MTDGSRAVQPAEASADGAQPERVVPRLLPGLHLGELDSGATEQAYLLTLPDGRNFQLAGALYHLTCLLDGERDTVEIAAALSQRIGRRVTAEEVETIVDRKLAPLGILAPRGLPELALGSGLEMGFGFGAPPAPAPDAALGILGRLPLVPARFFEPVAETAKQLYRPALAVPILLAIAAAHVYAYHELAPYLANFNPMSVPLAVWLLVLLAVQVIIPWHELGHAAAARSFGAQHGPMGVGLMGFGIVAYVDVGDVWRLPRRQRLVVDLGGVYFQSMTIVLFALWAWVAAQPMVLWVVLAMDFAMLMNLNPLFKLDGYWAVSDATGIPNLHQRVGQQLGSFAAARILDLARLLHVRRLSQEPRLVAAASNGGALDAFGGGARLALALYSVLFVLSAAYFLMLLVFIVPMMILSYPLIVVQAVLAVAAAVGGNSDAGFAVMALLQWVFVTALLANLAVAAVLLIRAARNRNRPPPGFAMGGWGARG